MAAAAQCQKANCDSDSDNEWAQDNEWTSDNSDFEIKTNTASMQSGTNAIYDYEVNLMTAKDSDYKKLVMNCIGQLILRYDRAGTDVVAGSGIILEKLQNDHYLVLSCAHNFCKKSPLRTLYPECVYFCPRGRQEWGNRMKCVETEIHGEWDADKAQCTNDLALALFVANYSNEVATVQYKDININNSISCKHWKDKDNVVLNLWGYPVASNGLLQGDLPGDACITNGFWEYSILAYHGQSGSPLFNRRGKANAFDIYGLHVWGDPSSQEHNVGICLDQKKLKWIETVSVKLRKSAGILTAKDSDCEKVIIHCIGQLLSWYSEYKPDGETESYSGSTGVILQKLQNNYYIVLTCAHNVCKRSPEHGALLYPKKLYFFPRGQKQKKNRMKCVETEIYSEYDAGKQQCTNDLALALFVAKKGVASVQYKDININDNISCKQWKDGDNAVLSLWGYPVDLDGLLRGVNAGDACITKKGFWDYSISTFKGQSGSPLFKRRGKGNGFDIYGVHAWSDKSQKHNTGIFLDEKKLKWIETISVKLMKIAKKQNKVVVKCGVLGDSQIGKLTLMKHLDNKYDEDYVETLGINFAENTVQLKNVIVTVSLWCLTGQREFATLLPLVCSDAKMILFVFDLTQKQSLFSVKRWYKEARKENKLFMPMLIGTKYDLFDELETHQKQDINKQARKLAKKMHAPLMYCSATQFINLKKIIKVIIAKVFDLRPKIKEAQDGTTEPLIEFNTYHNESDSDATHESGKTRKGKVHKKKKKRDPKKRDKKKKRKKKKKDKKRESDSDSSGTVSEDSKEDQ